MLNWFKTILATIALLVICALPMMFIYFLPIFMIFFQPILALSIWLYIAIVIHKDTLLIAASSAAAMGLFLAFGIGTYLLNLAVWLFFTLICAGNFIVWYAAARRYLPKMRKLNWLTLLIVVAIFIHQGQTPNLFYPEYDGLQGGAGPLMLFTLFNTWLDMFLVAMWLFTNDLFPKQKKKRKPKET